MYFHCFVRFLFCFVFVFCLCVCFGMFGVHVALTLLLWLAFLLLYVHEIEWYNGKVKPHLHPWSAMWRYFSSLQINAKAQYPFYHSIQILVKFQFWTLQWCASYTLYCTVKPRPLCDPFLTHHTCVSVPTEALFIFHYNVAWLVLLFTQSLHQISQP